MEDFFYKWSFVAIENGKSILCTITVFGQILMKKKCHTVFETVLVYCYGLL